MPDVLIIEDEPNLRSLFSDVLSSRGLTVQALSTLAEAERALAQRAPDLLVLDVHLPDGDGLALLARLRERGLRVPALVVTAYGTVERAVQALRAGASDFLVKPCDNARLAQAALSALERAAQLDELELAAPASVPPAVAERLVGAQGGLRGLAELLPRVAQSEVTVLLRGESGTGKELVARALHDLSPRLDGPFVAVNCAALPPSLLESELFGYERGAFTGAHAAHKGLVEQAQGGTLFLDEIGDMAPEAQARLLRVLQQREITRIGGRGAVAVDVRVVAATHRDLEALVRAGAFREDLLFRLAVLPLALPPLRQRPQDLPGLIEHFLAKHAARHRSSAPRLGPEVLAWAVGHGWPGNVRELENWVERAVVLGRFDLPGPAPARAPVLAPAPAPRPARTLREAVAEAERAAVLDALRAASGNKAEAARLLGVSYKTLFNKLHEHGIREETKLE